MRGSGPSARLEPEEEVPRRPRHPTGERHDAVPVDASQSKGASGSPGRASRRARLTLPLSPLSALSLTIGIEFPLANRTCLCCPTSSDELKVPSVVVPSAGAHKKKQSKADCDGTCQPMAYKDLPMSARPIPESSDSPGPQALCPLRNVRNQCRGAVETGCLARQLLQRDPWQCGDWGPRQHRLPRKEALGKPRPHCPSWPGRPGHLDKSHRDTR